MFLVANALGQSHLPAGEALGYALLGYGVVFLGLVLLMLVVTCIGKIFIARDQKIVKEQPVQVDPVEEVKPLAPGSAGEL